MKRVLFFTSIFLILLSCENDDNDLPLIAACDVNNPIEELSWLKSQIEELKNIDSETSRYFYIQIAEYKGETVFVSNNCCPFCNTVIPVYNCEGDLLGTFFTEIQPDEIKNAKILYSPVDFPCTVD
ncbi:hypothetical protein MTsPCn9_33790 [Croceitalea sp. MTPC9]|uniref:hypothetical protein n=1 Tax=unclassified Croceitalea TaxID=2632280 RepID=UPI002B3CF719|nr:hypothetical protein MTsPCn6_18240 [Croceitalea sp. MTPC6]GMN18439.1 hypothetical protein MTsPCn9_33790 [Croceitalea sp. MTPC9]